MGAGGLRQPFDNDFLSGGVGAAADFCPVCVGFLKGLVVMQICLGKIPRLGIGQL